MFQEDSRYDDQIEVLREFSEVLRHYMDKVGACYIKTEVVGDTKFKEGNGEALIYTALTFEVLINSLMSQEMASPDDSFLAILSHVTLTLGSLNQISKSFMNSYKELKQELGEFPSDEEMELQAEEMLGESWSPNKFDVEIPNIFKQAFGEDE